MKSVFKLFSLFFALMLASNISFAQETEVEISDEELHRYAVAMDSVERMKANILAVITEMVEGNEAITGKRYNELNNIIDDSVALVNANATPEEIVFVRSVIQKKDEMTGEINTTFKTLAIDYIGDGGRVYKKIKTALRSDEGVKERYQEIWEEIQDKADDAAEDAGDAVENDSKK